MAERVWVEDRNWWVDIVPVVLTCSFPRCDNKTVAGMHRPTTNTWPREYHYCADHLADYGRRIEGGKVLFDVVPGSPAAKAGFVR